MWMSNCLIVMDRSHEDWSSLSDIAAAVNDMGAAVVNVDEQQNVIEAAVPAHELATLRAIPGVAYIRCVFNYFCGKPPRRAA